MPFYKYLIYLFKRMYFAETSHQLLWAVWVVCSLKKELFHQTLPLLSFYKPIEDSSSCQHIFLNHLLCARHCSRHWRTFSSFHFLPMLSPTKYDHKCALYCLPLHYKWKWFICIHNVLLEWIIAKCIWSEHMTLYYFIMWC